MASQPDNYSEDVTTNSFIDFDQFLFSPTGFRYAYDDLIFNQGNEQLNTPDFERTNPFVPTTSGGYADPRDDTCTPDFEEPQPMAIEQEPSIPSEATDEDIVSIILDAETDGNGMNNNSDQHMDVCARKTIAEIENDLRNAADEMSDSMDLHAIVTAINRFRNAIMRIHTQPITQHRFRYRTDGIRYLERSRKNPMAINVLPRLDGYLTKLEQSFWVQLTLVTTQHNPQRKVFRHSHEMIYNAVNAQQNGLGSFRIPLTDKDIRQQRKTFRHLSIIKTKLNDYNFELIPFDPLIVDDHVEYYTLPNEDKITKVQKAKRFDRDYHTNNFQIVCQLMIKQKDQWYTTDLYCVTHVITDS